MAGARVCLVTGIGQGQIEWQYKKMETDLPGRSADEMNPNDADESN